MSRLQTSPNFAMHKISIVVFALVIAIILSSLGILSHIENEMKSEIERSLKAALNTSNIAIRRLFEEQKDTARFLANRPQIQKSTQELLNLSPMKGALRSSTAQADLRKWISPIFTARGYRGYFIIDHNNVNLASSRDHNIGDINILTKQKDFLSRVWAGETLMSLPMPSDVPLHDRQGNLTNGLPTMFVGAPIKNTDGDIIAILTLRLKPHATFTSVFEQTRLGRTDETYAFNDKGVLISDSRFNSQLFRLGLIPDDKHSSLRIEMRDPGGNLTLGELSALPRHEQPLTRMALSATKGKAGSDFEGYRDYRGVDVVGVWLWNKDLNFGVATKTDTAEAYATLHDTQITIAIFSLISVCVLLTFSVVSSRDKRKIVASFERTQSILNSAADGIFGVDAEGATTFANPAVCGMLGFEEKELVGQPTHDLIHHSYPDGSPYPKNDCKMYAAFFDGKQQDVANEVLWRKDGTSFPVEYTSTPIRNAGNFIGAVITFRDITERKLAEEELERQRSLFEAVFRDSPDAMLLTNTRRKIIMINPAMKRMFNYESEALLGQTTAMLYESNAEYEKQGRDRYHPASKETQKPYESRYRRKDSEIFPAETVGSAILDRNNEILGFLGVIRDITERKVIENDLIKARDVADKANRAKSEFLSSMSHELRTPMNSIIGFSQMLESNYKEQLTPTQQKCVDHILKGSRHLLELINEILDLSKIESGSINLEPESFYPSDVFRECLDLLQGMADEFGVTLDGNKESDKGITADRFRFKQIMINLLSNAIKYNQPGGSVTFGCNDTSDGNVHIFVSDTGKGIPGDRLDNIFAPFERLHNENSDIEGTGIGLTIAKRLVDTMGGDIGCSSIVGEGSTFWVDFPEAEQSIDPSAPHRLIKGQNVSQELVQGVKATVLYIEDDKYNTELMSLIISQIEGLSMISAHSAEIGIELARSKSPDMIIMDLNLPGMDGYDALKIIKQHEKSKDIPVIALSAAAMPRDLERGRRAGFQHYLTKPIDIAEVMTVTKELVEVKTA